ncbi:MAG: hypothetical protein SHS37scaffold145_32 [Phage 71_18]|nr:MAG: hypothetical protein SHS37scaffold145_32 [Phage 71_18]
MTAPPKISHTEFQAQVVDLLHLLGWSHLHVRRALGKGRRMVTPTNVDGWPDLWCWHQRLGFAGIELKVPGDYPTQAQLDVLQALRTAGQGAACVVAYPDDFDRLQALLRGRGAAWPYEGRLRR